MSQFHREHVDQIIVFAMLIYVISKTIRNMNMYAITAKLKQDLACLNLTRTALCLCLGLLGSGCISQSEIKKSDPKPLVNSVQDPNPMFNPALTGKAGAAKEMADWVIRSRDNQNMPFAIVDKVQAKVFVYDVNGKHQGEAPVLLGLAKGDYSPPGIGDKPLSQIKPEQRITPAGRFVARMGRNHKGKDILWVDYEEALSMHAVVKGVPRDRRAQRLSSETPLDNRISFGCINVPKPFFKNVILGKLSGTPSVVYILPETEEYGKYNSARISLAPNQGG